MSEKVRLPTLKHTLVWSVQHQRYGCSCGNVTFLGGEKKARVQHRIHRDNPAAAECKHENLAVQRNFGYRWVTCQDCLTDFVPAGSR